MEKASSLIEADESLDLEASDEHRSDTTAAGVTRGELAAVERSRSMRARLGEVDEVEGSGYLRGATPHERPFKPIESGVFSGMGHGLSSGQGANARSASTPPLSVPPPGGQVTPGQVTSSLQSALSSASRGEAELGALHRSLRDASRALTASRHAHEGLMEELRMMHRSLTEVLSEKAAVERYAALLTQERDAALDAAEDARREAKRERDFLLHEQDRFIQLLLEEHEAELQQLRRALASRPIPSVSPIAAAPAAARGDLGSDAGPATTPGVAPPPPPLASEQLGTPARTGSVPAQRSGTDTRELANGSERSRSIPLPEPAERGAFDTGPEALRPELSFLDPSEDERSSTYPPPPAVLDLDALAHEVDGNSERPPPIRRIGGEPKLHLRPARVPTQLFDTLISKTGDEPTRKG